MANWTPESLNHATRLRNKLQLAEDAERQRNTSEASQDSPGDAGGSEAGKDSPQSAAGNSGVKTYTLHLRPRALKNSRQSRGNYTAVNPKAAACLAEAKKLLRQQHGSEVLVGCYDLEVLCFYSDLKSWLDSDALQTWSMDLLKGVVVPDDSPKYLRDVTARPRLSRYKRNVVEIVLTEVLE